jgi:hypothetical protein
MITREDYMRGVPLPPGNYREVPLELNVRYVGVYLTGRGYQPVILKQPEAAPPGMVDLRKTSKKNAPSVLKDMLDCYRAGRPFLREGTENLVLAPSKPPTPFVHTEIGRIGDHYDGLSRHVAICLQVSEQDCDLLFFTSHLGWNSASRPARPDECGYTGLAWNTRTYLAPVTRFLRHVAWTNRRIPDTLLEELRAEFQGRFE